MKNKYVSNLVMALSLATLSAGIANANELFNPNLDAVAIGPQLGNTPIGWVIDASKSISGQNFDGAASATFANVRAAGGFGLFLKPFQGNAGAMDLLTVNFYQDNPGSPGTKYTFSGFSSAEANYSGRRTTNSPLPATMFVLQFIDSVGSVISSNEFDLVANGLPTGGGGSMIQLTMPQLTAPAGTVTVRAGMSMRNVYNTSGAQSIFVDAFDLAAEPPAGSPVISTQPVPTTVSPGGNASFTVAVSNPSGVSYEWKKDGVALVDGGTISGAATATLNITGASSADVGQYRVRVSNSNGSLHSDNAPLAILGLAINPVITVTGNLVDTYRVDYATALAPTTWIPLVTNRLTSTSFQVIDPASGTSGQRFYRAVFLP